MEKYVSAFSEAFVSILRKIMKRQDSCIVPKIRSVTFARELLYLTAVSACRVRIWIDPELHLRSA